MENCVKKMNEKYGEGTVELKMNDQYYNMKEKIDPNMHVVELVLRAMQQANVALRCSRSVVVRTVHSFRSRGFLSEHLCRRSQLPRPL